MTRVLLVDDDPLVVAGLRMLLGGDPSIVVVGDVSDGDQVVEAVTRLSPEVVLMDIRMSRLDGIAALKTLRALPPPHPAVVMLTTFDAEPVVLDALRAGAAGFLLKHTPPERIVESVHAAASGEATVSPVVLQLLIEKATDALPDDAVDPLAGLSDRERDVAHAVADGLANGDIAASLYISVGSVKAHISSALAKLGLENRVQLAIAAHGARRG